MGIWEVEGETNKITGSLLNYVRENFLTSGRHFFSSILEFGHHVTSIFQKLREGVKYVWIYVMYNVHVTSIFQK